MSFGLEAALGLGLSAAQTGLGLLGSSGGGSSGGSSGSGADMIGLMLGAQMGNSVLEGGKASQAALDKYLADAVGYVQPWQETGKSALADLWKMVQAGPGEFETSPGYQFRLDEAEKSITRNAAATGNAQSGKALKALTQYSQNYATNDYDNWLNRYYQSLTPYQYLSAQGLDAGKNMAASTVALGSRAGLLPYQSALANAGIVMDAYGNYGGSGGGSGSGYGSGGSDWTGIATEGLNALGSVLGYGLGGGFGSDTAKSGYTKPSSSSWSGIGGNWSTNGTFGGR